ncbi:MAG: hypothetical protein K8T91_19405 [Planctomycetes bacterium]|nr:hypothetical protein [Planctomycetota bacterium]
MLAVRAEVETLCDVLLRNQPSAIRLAINIVKTQVKMPAGMRLNEIRWGQLRIKNNQSVPLRWFALEQEACR